MNFVGTWVFHSFGSWDEDGNLIYMDAQQYLDSPMDYVDTEDPEAVADELRERKNTIGTKLKVCPDGKLYMLMPLPEGVAQAEVDAAVEAGAITLLDNMITDAPHAWELREDALWMDTGITGEMFGETTDTWTQISESEQMLRFMNIRFVKEEA